MLNIFHISQFPTATFGKKLLLKNMFFLETISDDHCQIYQILRFHL